MTPRLSPLSRKEIKHALDTGRLDIAVLARETCIRRDRLNRWIYIPADGPSDGIIDQVGDLQAAIRKTIKAPRKPKKA